MKWSLLYFVPQRSLDLRLMSGRQGDTVSVGNTDLEADSDFRFQLSRQIYEDRLVRAIKRARLSFGHRYIERDRA